MISTSFAAALAAGLLLSGPSAPAAQPAAGAEARAEAARPPPVKPEPGEKCPVCGMFVARYPDWVAGVRFEDGGRALFDGAKDLFKFQLRLEDYGPAARRGAPVAAFVTDYYALTPVDARAAFYVVGSDVLGPMGHELVPFERREDAEEFRRDHRGKRILRYGEVTAELLRALDGEG